MMTAAIVRVMLVVDIIVMTLLALVYLRQRRMSWSAYFCWGMLAVSVPVIGPFIVIANRPGDWDPSFSLQEDLSRFLGWMHRMLPDPPRSPAHSRSRRQFRQHR